jgi:hypothetical protein
LLREGFLTLQSEDIHWTALRIRSLENAVTREKIIVVPLYECYGSAPGTSTNNRAFRFNLYEKFMKTIKSLHLRGVVEDLSTYGTTGSITKELKQSVQICESLFVGPFVPTTGITLLPGRLDGKRIRSGVYEVTPVLAAYGVGIVDLPESNESRKSSSIRKLRTKL